MSQIVVQKKISTIQSKIQSFFNYKSSITGKLEGNDVEKKTSKLLYHSNI